MPNIKIFNGNISLSPVLQNSTIVKLYLPGLSLARYYIIMSSLYKNEYLSHYSSVVNRLSRCKQLGSRITTDVFTYAFKHNDILFCSILFHLMYNYNFYFIVCYTISRCLHISISSLEMTE